MPSKEKLIDSVRTILRYIDGFGDAAKKGFRRFLTRVCNMEPGELVEVEAVIPRNPRFHRKYFALLSLSFESWEPDRKHKTHKGIPVQKEFEQFREDITILAGYYTQAMRLDGSMVLRAKSISFRSMEQPEFEALYEATITVLMHHVLTKYKDREEVDSVIEKILAFT